MATIGEWIAIQADDATASAYVRRFVERCTNLADFPARGTPRPEFGQDIRSVVVAKHLILYRTDEQGTTILRIFHGSRDIRAVWID